ncbi:MAG: hypothetical protein KKG00_06120 [Bacteroidetes bacterium]|nr:hypothetical protein [Bacteroidota bacterium]
MSTLTPLTDEQIDALLAFVKSKYVDYYDVQLELVDHLASEVEQRMAANPAVSFDTALQQVYAGFGIFGFSDLVGEKTKAITRRNHRLWWQSFVEFFQLPKIVISLLVALLLVSIFIQWEPKSFLLANGLLALLADVLIIYHFYRHRPRNHYKITAFQYHSTIHLGVTFNLYQSYFISYILLLPSLSGPGLLLIPLLCWTGWLVFAACVVAFEKMLKEQQKLYPMAFA